jgi:hypothetical protein
VGYQISIVVFIGLAYLLPIFGILKGVKFTGLKSTLSKNLFIGLTAGMMMLTTLSNFGPETFGLYSQTNP